MSTSVRAAALLSLVLVSTNTRASDLESSSRATDSFMAASHTTVAISDDASAATRLLAQLTTARAVMKRVVAVELPSVRAFGVRNETALRELVPQYWERRGTRPYGVSYAGPHTGFIAVRTDTPVPQQFPLLLHEYVHLLTTAHVSQAPAWLDEGMAEFWGGLRVESGQAVVGRPLGQHLKLLRTRTWLPLDEMRNRPRGKLDPNATQASMFYAQSWAVVHYLLLGRNPSQPLTFAPSDQTLTPQLDAEVRAYVTGGRLREVAIPLGAAAPLPPAAHRISEARALAERANMVVFGERPDAALALAQRALSLEPAEPVALEVMGTYYFLHNQPDRAREWLQRAFDAEHKSYSAALYLALLSSTASERERYLVAAVTANPGLEVAWQRLWTLYNEDGRTDQVRRLCDRLTGMMEPWLWLDQPVRCHAQDRR